MKREFILIQHSYFAMPESTWNAAVNPITRDRAAYLLRAARSRRSNNVAARHPHTYAIRDCNTTIARKA